VPHMGWNQTPARRPRRFGRGTGILPSLPIVDAIVLKGVIYGQS